MRQRTASAWATLGAAALGLGAGHAVAAVTGPRSSPVLAVGALVVDAVPGPVKDWAVSTFGTADKAVLVGGVIAVTSDAALALGALAWRRPRLIAAGLAGLGLVGTAAGLLRADGGSPAAVPGLVAIVVAVLTVHLTLNLTLRPRARTTAPTTPAPSDQEPPPQVPRRTVVAAGAASLGGAVALGYVGNRYGGGAVPAPRPLPAAPSPAPTLPAGLETQVSGLSPLRTPTADFYRIDIALTPPRIAPADWRLRIDGMVDAPYELTFDELVALPLIERDITLTCVSNEVGGDLCGSARWLGVPVAPLLRRARPRAGADQVLSRAEDGFTASTPLATLLDGRDALIAVGMNGRALEPTHGAPARLLTPGLYGFVGATKWLTTLTVTTFAAESAYWTRRGWAATAPVKTASRIDVPRRGAVVRPGPVAFGGVAWATHRGVARVEVRLDDGPWQEARLGPDVGVDYWRQWSWAGEVTPGRHALTVRATDGTGALQPEWATAPAPDGATGWHRVEFTVG